ncbi:hypothetical protein D3C71_1847170 [compost metagenome]
MTELDRYLDAATRKTFAASMGPMRIRVSELGVKASPSLRRVPVRLKLSSSKKLRGPEA